MKLTTTFLTLLLTIPRISSTDSNHARDLSFSDLQCWTYNVSDCGFSSKGNPAAKLFATMRNGENVPSPGMKSVQCTRNLKDNEQIDLSTYPIGYENGGKNAEGHYPVGFEGDLAACGQFQGRLPGQMSRAGGECAVIGNHGSDCFRLWTH